MCIRDRGSLQVGFEAPSEQVFDHAQIQQLTQTQKQQQQQQQRQQYCVFSCVHLVLGALMCFVNRCLYV